MKHNGGNIRLSLKHNGGNISIKWKVFFYLLGFTVVLLAILWLFQICYLDAFYKRIKTEEAKRAMEEAIAVLETEKGQEELEALAASYNLSILAVDSQGTVRSCAFYFPNPEAELLPEKELQFCYNAAKEQGGSAKFVLEEKEGIRPGPEPEKKEGADGGPAGPGLQGPDMEALFGGHRQKPGESILNVKLFTKDGETLAALVYSALTPVDATVTTLKTQLLWMSVPFLLLSLLLSLLISGKMTRSLVGINASAKELARGNYRIAFSGTDCREIAELSDTLNYAARELEKTEGLRRELIANVSHDLRTPLTMITAYAEGMRDLPGENTPENIQVIIEEAERLTDLVNDLLDLSKLQAGVLEMEASVYNLTESIRGVLKRYNKLMEQEGYCITFDYKEEVCVKADEFKIFQVVYNLINNAIHYTGKDKRVTVRQIRVGEKVRIEVEDSGQGIPKEEIPFVWERYYKGKNAHKRAAAGTGLGLSIVKNILLLHRADYGVDSHPGKGSIFWFELDC